MIRRKGQPASDKVAHARRRAVLPGAEGRKIAAGIFLIALVLFGQDLYGRATASARLDPTLRGATTPRNVVVVLSFMPDRFHNERVAEYGVFAGRDGALNRIRLRNVSPDSLARLAAVPWVARVEPAP
ncbi:MAG: hypothetical protein J2P53_04355 [Bradyrhizobiaceae bacterium]|nr:hypothetical protein [Bradyrhizobiaceae bacterium]